MNFDRTGEFQKDLKRLAKKWRSLPNDMADAQLGLVALYIPQEGVDIKVLREAFFNTKRAAILQQNDETEVVKMRLDVADVGSKDIVRLVFIAVKTRNTITFVELYAKNEKPREDPSRYKRYIS